MILVLLMVALIALGWHTVWMWLSWDLHPLRILVEVLGVLLIYHLARKLIDQIGRKKAP